jgi:hypothetical protein
MSKYLILEFDNAKLFPKDKSFNNKDKVIENNLTIKKGVISVTGSKRTDRNIMLNFVEPITVNQISNALHVFFGERPVPSFRNVFYSKVDKIYEMAMNSYLNISSLKINKSKENNETEFIGEFFQTAKSVNNSYTTSDSTNMSWETIRKYLLKKVIIDGKDETSNEYYIEFINIMKYIFGEKITSERFVDVREKILTIQNDKLDSFLIKMNENKNGALYKYLKKSDTSPSVLITKKTSLQTNIRGTYSFKNLKGIIYVPVSDEDILKLRRNTVRILDGGLLRIVEVKDGNYLHIDGFRKVSEITTEKY